MLLTILNKMNADSYLSSTLKALTGAYGSELPFVKYSYVPLTNDAIKATARFEVTAVSNSIGTSLEIIDNISRVLLTLGDTPLTSDILAVEHNGGGQLFNEETKTWHIKANYLILYKERG